MINTPFAFFLTGNKIPIKSVSTKSIKHRTKFLFILIIRERDIIVFIIHKGMKACFSYHISHLSEAIILAIKLPTIPIIHFMNFPLSFRQDSCF